MKIKSSKVFMNFTFKKNIKNIYGEFIFFCCVSTRVFCAAKASYFPQTMRRHQKKLLKYVKKNRK